MHENYALEFLRKMLSPKLRVYVQEEFFLENQPKKTDYIWRTVENFLSFHTVLCLSLQNNALSKT